LGCGVGVWGVGLGLWLGLGLGLGLEILSDRLSSQRGEVELLFRHRREDHLDGVRARVGVRVRPPGWPKAVKLLAP
jgi:hypothetical protein